MATPPAGCGSRAPRPDFIGLRRRHSERRASTRKCERRNLPSNRGSRAVKRAISPPQAPPEGAVAVGRDPTGPERSARGRPGAQLPIVRSRATSVSAGPAPLPGSPASGAPGYPGFRLAGLVRFPSGLFSGPCIRRPGL
ncbi:hypothetical protein ACRRTK_012482 [Alexandromys fortis]